MDKNLKNKKKQKTKIYKKLKSKSKSYKQKIKTKKINSKKYNDKYKKYSKKYSKKYRGGANHVPVLNENENENEIKLEPKLALFFDNDIKNFRGLEDCPNIILVKVNDNNKKSKEIIYNNVIVEVEDLAKKDNIDIYTNYISNENLLKYDGESGITTEQLNILSELFVENEDYDLITDIILDFDRTFTKCEGLYRFPNLLTIAKLLYSSKPSSPEITDEENEQIFINLLMGGIERTQAMKNFLEICIDLKKTITILTNNCLPVIFQNLFPDIISIILNVSLNSDLNIDIVSTKKIDRMTKDCFKFKSKGDIINENICTEYDVSIINKLKDDLETNILDLNILEFHN
jgi:hypothetical protein